MPSQRNDLKLDNVNGSKNTRMDFSRLNDNMDYRKDEVMHIGRYTNAAGTMVDLSKKLKRPIRVLDIGCGEMNSARLLYKAVQGKKSEILKEYVGVDIDYIMANKAKEKYGNAYRVCNARFVIQDLTVNSSIPFSDGYFDFVICFEFLEHVQPRFAPPILKEVARVLNVNGLALFSTPNSNGSNEKLPHDHIYEYSYEELLQMFQNAGFLVEDATGVCVNISKIPAEEKNAYRHILERYYRAFGDNTAFASVAVAPLFDPRNCKNVVYRLIKE